AEPTSLPSLCRPGFGRCPVAGLRSRRGPGWPWAALLRAGASPNADDNGGEGGDDDRPRSHLAHGPLALPRRGRRLASPAVRPVLPPPAFPPSRPSSQPPPSAMADGAATGAAEARMAMVGLVPNVGDGSAAAAASQGIESGTPTCSNKSVQATLRVLVVTTLLAAFYTLWFVGELLLTKKWRSTENDVEGVWSGINTLLVDLIVPACGYYGALYGNRHLTCCFCTCTLMLSTLAISMVVLKLLANLHSIRWQEFGEDDCKKAFGTLLDLCAFWFAAHLYSQMPSNRPTFLTPLVGQVVHIERGVSPAPASHGASTRSDPEEAVGAAGASPGAATRPSLPGRPPSWTAAAVGAGAATARPGAASTPR
ncbi:unnamed protein product, partial [Prorocentrum cordatum]